MALLATRGESEEHRREAVWGRLFFGYFLLAAQKKVSRPRVREPDSNQRRGSDSLNHKVTHPRRHSLLERGSEAIYSKKAELCF